MAVLAIRNIEDAVNARLRARAAMLHRSMEVKARDIILIALSAEAMAPNNLFEAIHSRFALAGGIELPEIDRDTIRTPAIDADG